MHGLPVYNILLYIHIIYIILIILRYSDLLQGTENSKISKAVAKWNEHEISFSTEHTTVDSPWKVLLLLFKSVVLH